MPVALTLRFRIGDPSSVASYISQNARESKFFVVFVAHHDACTGDAALRLLVYILKDYASIGHVGTGASTTF
jgi:hypothetical protein